MWSMFQKGKLMPWMSAYRPIFITSSSKRSPSASLVVSSPPFETSTKLTPLPSEYEQRCPFRRLNRLDLIRMSDAV